MTPCCVVEFYFLHIQGNKYGGGRLIMKYWHLSTRIYGVIKQKTKIFTKCSQFHPVPRED
jgi:hypothetical protein